ncbi:hypothetical protein GF337_20630 [candidate division KSB1 bacterium]|nr:hypothetical protein [candidate division KSB1 bacterium]
MQTNVKIEPRIYVYESNTTECMHHFSSTGELEKALLTKLNANIDRAESHIIDREKLIELFENNGSPSLVLEKQICGKSSHVQTIMEKILRDHDFTFRISNPDAGFILTGYHSVPGQIKDRYIQKELVIPFGGFDKALSIWEDPYRLSLSVKVSQPDSADSLQLTLKTYYERYESNTTERWHRFKSTGSLENEIMMTLEKALTNVGEIDNHCIAGLHFEPVQSEVIEYPMPQVWLAVLKTFHDRKIKIRKSTIDSALVIVSEYKKQGNPFCSYSLMARQIDSAKTRLDISLSSRQDDPAIQNLIVRYDDSPENLVPEFFAELKYCLAEVDSLLMDSTFAALSDSIFIENFIRNLDLMKATACVPDFELAAEWIKIIDDGNEKRLAVTLLVKEPFVTTEPVCDSCVSELLFKNYVDKLTLSLETDPAGLSKIKEVDFRFIFKIHNLDDESPIDNRYHDRTIALTTNSFVNRLR